MLEGVGGAYAQTFMDFDTFVMKKTQYVQTFMDFDTFVMKKNQYVQTFMDFDTFVMKKTNMYKRSWTLTHL